MKYKVLIIEIKSLSYIGMGGIFLRYLPLLIVSIIFGYFYINWLPLPSTITVYTIIMEFVLNPVLFFVATISFFIGFITNGIFIRRTILMFKSVKKYNRNMMLEPILNILILIFTYFFLVKLKFWPMTLFFSFSFVYGMMTIGKNN
jgi:hypothetical protein